MSCCSGDIILTLHTRDLLTQRFIGLADALISGVTLLANGATRGDQAGWGTSFAKR